MQFADDLKEIRGLQKGIFSMKFRRESPSEDMFVLPKLPNNGRNQADRRIISTMQLQEEQSRRLMTIKSDHDSSPVRHSM